MVKVHEILCVLIFWLSGVPEGMKEIPIPKDPDDFRGVNRGNMGPMDLTAPSEERIWGRR